MPKACWIIRAERLFFLAIIFTVSGLTTFFGYVEYSNGGSAGHFILPVGIGLGLLIVWKIELWDAADDWEICGNGIRLVRGEVSERIPFERVASFDRPTLLLNGYRIVYGKPGEEKESMPFSVIDREDQFAERFRIWKTRQQKDFEKKLNDVISSNKAKQAGTR